MIGAVLVSALEQTLSAHPELAARLAPHAGKTVRIVLAGAVETVRLDEHGRPARAAAGHADAEVRIPLDAALQWPVDRIAARRRIGLSGDTELALAVAEVLSRSRPDAEEAAARVIGDIPAHRLFELWRLGRASASDRWQRLLETAGDYARYEGRLIAARADLDRFNQAVDALRDDAARLEMRLRRLEDGR